VFYILRIVPHYIGRPTPRGMGLALVGKRMAYGSFSSEDAAQAFVDAHGLTDCVIHDRYPANCKFIEIKETESGQRISDGV